MASRQDIHFRYASIRYHTHKVILEDVNTFRHSKHSQARPYTHTHTHTHRHANMQTRKNTNTSTHTHTHTHSHTNTRTHTHRLHDQPIKKGLYSKCGKTSQINSTTFFDKWQVIVPAEYLGNSYKTSNN